MKKLTKQESGQRGAEIRWAPRYQALKELAKHYSRSRTEWFRKEWKTTHLVELIKWVNK